MGENPRSTADMLHNMPNNSASNAEKSFAPMTNKKANYLLTGTRRVAWSLSQYLDLVEKKAVAPTPTTTPTTKRPGR